MSVFQSMQVSSSALRAQSTRLNTISSNLANINSTSTPEGGPYREKSVIFRSTNSQFDQHLRNIPQHELPVRPAAAVQSEGSQSGGPRGADRGEP